MAWRRGGRQSGVCWRYRHRQESASFIQSFCKLGLIPDTGGTFVLPRLVGRARAAGLALLGDKLSAKQAQDWGLIWQCVADAEFDATLERLAQHFAKAPTRAWRSPSAPCRPAWPTTWRRSWTWSAT